MFQMITGSELINNPYQIQSSWKAPMIAAMRGFMPRRDRRLSIATKSGNAANVVPNPATNPTTSSREDVDAGRPNIPEKSLKTAITVSQADRDYCSRGLLGTPLFLWCQHDRG